MELDLRNNNIRQLSYDALLSQISQDQFLLLDGNNAWDCTCELRWLQSSLAFSRRETSLRCGSPLYMFKRNILEDELVCPPSSCTNVPLYQTVVASVGDLIRIACPIRLTDVDTLEWMGTIPNSSETHISSSLQTYYSRDGTHFEISSLSFPVLSSGSNVHCNVSNRAGSTAIDIRINVCDSPDLTKCTRNGSVTATEWNGQVAKLCEESGPVVTTIPVTTKIASSHEESDISKASSIKICVSICFLGILQLSHSFHIRL